MIKIENTEVLGWEASIRGMRNPMNSWAKSDSWFYESSEEGANYYNELIRKENYEDLHCSDYPEDREEYLRRRKEYKAGFGCGDLIGPDDHKLMMNLAKAGSVDAKYRRMIVVYADITAPLYWWKEFDTYKVSTVANSCSTMHKIHSKEFTLDDFSCEHLLTGEEFGDTAEELWDAGAFHVEHDYDPYDVEGIKGWYEAEYAKDVLLKTIDALNHYREKFLEAIECAKKEKEESDRCKRVNQVPAHSGRYFEIKAKQYWWQLIQLLPSSYNQRRTVMLNYEVLAGIYPKRKDHKLDEWHTYCDWIKSLPYSEIITLEE